MAVSTFSRARLNALPAECRTKSSGASTECRKPASAAQPLIFRTMAYAFGQFCLPYSVPVRRIRMAGAH